MSKKSHKKPDPLLVEQIDQAYQRIRKALPPTPVSFSQALSERTGKEVYLKWENKHRTGSFKERGALNFLLSLSDAERAKGVCAASAGNHALALSYHAARLSTPCTIVMPKTAPLVKLSRTQKHGAEVVLHGETFNDAYQFGLKLAQERSLIFVPPFDDARVIAGQGTAGLELLHDLVDFDALLIPVGGGGLISGIATAVRDRLPNIHVVGIQSAWVKDHKANQTGDPRLRTPSIADGIAVKQLGALTTPIIDSCVDTLVSVTDAEISRGVIEILEVERVVIEGAAAAAVAALDGDALPSSAKKVVVVISGSNIDTNLLSRLIERDLAESGRITRLSVSLPDRPGALHAITGLLANHGANILEVSHNRSFSVIPGAVEVILLLEVRDTEHKMKIIDSLKKEGLAVEER